MIDKDQWQTIETAPKDTLLLFYWLGVQGDEVPHNCFTALATIHNNRSKLWVMNSWDNEKVWPTHWMPLPNAPTEDTPQ